MTILTIRYCKYRLLPGTVVAAISFTAAATPLTLSDTPLFLTAAVIPNVVMTLDNSLSMSHAHVPDTLGHNASGQNVLSQRRYKSNYYNALYYSPFLTYPIPTRNDGITYSTSFNAAYVNGMDTSKGSINLSNNYSVTFFYQPDVTATTYTSSSCAFQSATATGTPIGGWGNTCMRARNPSADFSGSETSGVPAYYYVFWSQRPGQGQPNNCTGTAAQQKEDDDCYIKINVGSTTAPIDLFNGTQAQQQQNFANWFSFYRSRALAAMSGAMSAVTSLSDNSVRFAWRTVNASGGSGGSRNASEQAAAARPAANDCTSFGTGCNGYTSTNSENRIRPLDDLKTGSATVSHRTDFYDWIQRFDLNGSTPLRSVLKSVGDYYQTSGINSPYAEDPYISRGTELSCRKNYHVLFTDGLWNSDNNDNFGGNVDSTSDTLPDGTTYTPQYPFKNTSTAPPSGMSYSNSLADIAFKYWKTDLRSDLDNNIIPHTADRTGTTAQQYWNAKNDPATWQHMVNFAVGLGLSASLTDPAWGGSTYAGDYAALGGNPPYTATKYWPAIDEAPTTGSEPASHVYDLWHTAINSRGKFFSVEDPVALQDAFKTIFSDIVSTGASAAALAASSTSIQTGTVLYQAQFDSRDWSGHLYNFTVQSDGTIQDVNSDGKLNGSDANWDAATHISAATATPADSQPSDSRHIFTYDGSAGSVFAWANLTTAQQSALKTSDADTMGPDRVDWLRGVSAKEQRYTGGIFRNRTVTVLGDIINSDPTYVYNGDYGFSDLPASTSEHSSTPSYATFVSDKSSRVPMIYVGANDGMLHAFRAATNQNGAEEFAYIPAGVYGNLRSLSDTAYTHKYFVDGAPKVSDAYLSNSWKTVLVGGLGGGGKTIYALDITSPTIFAASNVLWEYAGAATDTGSTGVTDADGMGLTYSQPQIARLNDGSWAAIFGNGYNSTGERAFLYIVNLSNGDLITKIPTDTSTSNGLSTPVLYDSNADKIIDYVYAGDLQGRLWKFDLSASDSTSWALGNNGSPLFTARNSSNQVQPITAPPVVGGHPSGGVLIYFGTGSYLTNGDVSNTDDESFYAIWDKPAATGTVLRANLQAQTITLQTSQFGYSLRETSKNTVDWATKRGWYLDLVPPGGSGGERIVSSALLMYDRVIFVTLIPSVDPCLPGGDSWLMELDVTTGGATALSSFDFNNDDKFDNNDLLQSGNTASGLKSTVGIVKAPVWLDKEGSGYAYKEMSGSKGNVMSPKNRKPNPGGGVQPVREYWLQIQ